MAIRIGVIVDGGQQLPKLAQNLIAVGTAAESMVNPFKKGSAEWKNFDATIKGTSAALKTMSAGLTVMAKAMNTASVAGQKMYSVFSKMQGIKLPQLYASGKGSRPLQTAVRDLNKLKKEADSAAVSIKKNRKEFLDFANGVGKVNRELTKATGVNYKYTASLEAEGVATKQLEALQGKYIAALASVENMKSSSYRTYAKRVAYMEQEAVALKKLIDANVQYNSLGGFQRQWKSHAAAIKTEEKMIRLHSAALKENAIRSKQVAHGATGMSKAFSASGSAIRGLAGSMGMLWASYGQIIPLMAAFAAASTVKEIIALGGAFEYTTTFIDALGKSAEKSIKSVQQIQKSLMGLKGLRSGPIDLALGMKEFSKAGVSAGQSLQYMAEMSKFATIAEIELNDAIKLVIGQSKAFDQSFSDSANMIAAAAMSSATTIQEMGTAMSYTTELASVSGIAFNEVATAMALMANAGIRGSKAGTALRTSIIKMQAPSTKLKNSLDEMGISWSAFTDEGKIKSLRTMFMELERVTNAMPDEQRIAVLKELFGLRAMKGGATILKNISTQWDGLNSKIKESTQGVSFVSEKYEELSNTLTAQWDLLKVEFSKLLLDLSNTDWVKNQVKEVRVFVTGIREAIQALKNLNIEKNKKSEDSYLSKIWGERGEEERFKLDPALKDLANQRKVLGLTIKLWNAYSTSKEIAERNPYSGEADVAGLAKVEERLKNLVDFQEKAMALYMRLGDSFAKLSKLTREEFDVTTGGMNFGDFDVDAEENLNRKIETFRSLIDTLQGLGSGAGYMAGEGGGPFANYVKEGESFQEKLGEIIGEVKVLGTTIQSFTGEGRWSETIIANADDLDTLYVSVRKLNEMSMSPYEKQLSIIDHTYTELINKLELYLLVKEGEGKSSDEELARLKQLNVWKAKQIADLDVAAGKYKEETDMIQGLNSANERSTEIWNAVLAEIDAQIDAFIELEEAIMSFGATQSRELRAYLINIATLEDIKLNPESYSMKDPFMKEELEKFGGVGASALEKVNEKITEINQNIEMGFLSGLEKDLAKARVEMEAFAEAEGITKGTEAYTALVKKYEEGVYKSREAAAGHEELKNSIAAGKKTIQEQARAIESLNKMYAKWDTGIPKQAMDARGKIMAEYKIL